MQEPAELGNTQALYITPETLEDRFLHDDVFVDYFNVFLQLKAFPTPLRYERLDGFYVEEFNLPDADPDLKQLVDDRGKFHQQGTATSWVKEHRLPFFLRSHLFLEFKLCKLLLRKLLETSRMPQSRLELRGYSRATSPHPRSMQWQDSPVGFMSQASWPVKDLPHYNRPLGSACSLPAMLSIALETRLKLLEGPPDNKLSTAEKDENSTTGQDDLDVQGSSAGTNETNNHNDAVSFNCEIQNEAMDDPGHSHKEVDVFDEETCSRQLMTSAQSRRITKSRKRRTSLFTAHKRSAAGDRTRSGTSGRRRTRSAPVKGGLALRTRSTDDSHDVFLDDYDLGFAFGEDDTIFDFDDAEADGVEAELQSIVDESKRNLQEMKEDALKSTLGMKDFRNFLHGTSGMYLLNFWLDVEEYKDLVESDLKSEDTLQMMRIKLFREINDKYKSYLTSEAKQRITEALNNDGLTKNLFTMTQYDALRRLRSYWIPRFLVHKEKTRDARLQQSRVESSCDTALSFLPTMSFVHSLPPRGDWCTELARRSCDWSNNLTLADVKPRLPRKQVSAVTADGRDDYQSFLSGVSSEKEAGWPFHFFLEKINKKEEVSNLLFWQSIEDLKNEEARGCDRHLHLCNAWNIVKQFLSHEADMVVNLNELDKLKIIDKLRNSMEVSSTLFKSGQTHALVILRTSWEEYKNNDQQVLKKCTRVPSAHHFSSKSKKDGGKHGLLYHGFFSPGKWYPRYPESSPSERQRRLHTALTIAETIEVTRTSSRSPQKSRASIKKTKSPNKAKAVKTEGVNRKKGSRERTSSQDGGEEEENVPEKPPLPKFMDVVGDKATISSFKHYIQNTEGSHGMNNLAMFLDIEAYKDIPSSMKEEKTQQAAKIFKDFFEPSSRRNVQLPASIPYQVQNECPSSPTLLEAQAHVLLDIETSFRQFYKSHRVPKPAVGNDTSHTKHAAKTDAPLTSTGVIVYYKRRRNRFKGPGRVQPTKEDKSSLVKELRENSGPLSLTLELFQRYLDSNDDIQGESVSKLENGLLFYLQVQKFKDLFNYMDDTTLVRKVDAIVDCFLDSATPPSVQIDISPDLSGRIVHRVQSFHTRNRDQRDSLMFDEAQNIVLKELLPYWAGFMAQQHDSPSSEPPPEKLPPTRRQIIMKRRYSEFKKFPLKKRPTSLRSVLPGIGESKRELNFSVADGLAWKEGIGEETDSVYSMNVRGSTRSDSRHVTREHNIPHSRMNSSSLMT